MDELKAEFDAFRQACVDLAILINSFDVLFGDDPGIDPSDLTTGHDFLADLNRWMIELYFVRAFRLLDRPEGMGRENLTCTLLVERLRERGFCINEIERLADDLQRYCETIKLARNRTIAHADRETLLGMTSLGGHSEEEFLEFRQNLQGFCDAVGRAIGVGPCEFINIAPGDVSEIRHLLTRRESNE